MILLPEEKGKKKAEDKERKEIHEEEFIVGLQRELRKAYVETPLPPKESMPMPKKPKKEPKSEED